MKIIKEVTQLAQNVLQEELRIETYDFIKFCKFLEEHLNCTKAIPNKKPTKYLFNLEKTRKLNTVSSGMYTAVLTRHYKT